MYSRLSTEKLIGNWQVIIIPLTPLSPGKGKEFSSYSCHQHDEQHKIQILIMQVFLDENNQ